MIGNKTLEQALKITPVISTEMKKSIELWVDMYQGNSYWLKEPTASDPERITSIGLPAMIASEKARMAVLEFSSEITAPTEVTTIENPNYQLPKADKDGVIHTTTEPKFITEEKVIGDTTRAEYLNKQYQTKILPKLRNITEYLVALGGYVIKPYVTIIQDATEEDVAYDMEFDLVHADMFYPLAFDSTGKLIDAAFIQPRPTANAIYYRVERHTLNRNTVIITNTAYKNENPQALYGSDKGVDLGQEISLSEVSEWANLSPKSTINNVNQLLFVYIKMPEANTIDLHSPLGVSGYSRAVDLIKDADIQYSTYLWEYEGGQMAIDIDRDALKTFETADGRTFEMPSTRQNRLMRKVELGEDNTYQVFAPALRDANYQAGLDTILKRIEDVCSISRGTLSDVTTEAKTATELNILKQRNYAANAELQKSLENGLKELVSIMDIYCTIYNIVGDVILTPDGIADDSSKGQYEISFEWDDSILVDKNEELGKRITLQQNGLAGKVENRMWYFGETEAQAREALKKIADEEKEAMENSLTGVNSGGF